MQSNTVKFVLFSTIFLLAWYLYFQPKQDAQQQQMLQQQQQQTVTQSQETSSQETTISNEPVSKQEVVSNIQNIKEEEITIETDKYKAVFSNKGAAIKQLTAFFDVGNAPAYHNGANAVNKARTEAAHGIFDNAKDAAAALVALARSSGLRSRAGHRQSASPGFVASAAPLRYAPLLLAMLAPSRVRREPRPPSLLCSLLSPTPCLSLVHRHAPPCAVLPGAPTGFPPPRPALND